jgi:hypothetical protein
MRLTIKDDAGTTVLDIAGEGIPLLLARSPLVSIVGTDTGHTHTTPIVCLMSAMTLRDIGFGYSEWARGQANKSGTPISDVSRSIIAEIRRVVGT